MTLNSRSLLVIGTVSAGWAFSFGLGSQAVSHWLNAQATGDTVIGLSHSFYYFGLAAASCLVPWVARRVGPTWCAAGGMFFSGVTLFLFPFGNDEISWYLLRFLNGWGGAMSVIPLETVVSRESPPAHRTLNFGIYGAAIVIGGAIGIAVAPYLYSLGYHLAFGAGAAVAVGAGVLTRAGLKHRAAESVDASVRIALAWRLNFLSYGTAWSQGFLEGGMIAFLALFLEERGLTKEAAGLLMGVTTVGAIVFQVPVSWCADRLGKTPILLGCYAMVLLTLAVIPWLPPSWWLALTLFAFGACTGAMYPLGLSLLGERIAESGLARAYAWYLAIECVGSQLGSAAMGRARDMWGGASMFAVGLIAVVAVLGAWVIINRSQRSAVCLDGVTGANQHRNAA